MSVLSVPYQMRVRVETDAEADTFVEAFLKLPDCWVVDVTDGIWVVETTSERVATAFEELLASKTPTRRERYADYLASDHWRGLRQWALERAERRCQVCNSKDRQLQVHHRTYERVGSELPSDLIVLCDSCHSTFHKNGRLA